MFGRPDRHPDSGNRASDTVLPLGFLLAAGNGAARYGACEPPADVAATPRSLLLSGITLLQIHRMWPVYDGDVKTRIFPV